MFLHYLGKFECSAVQLYSKAIQFRSDTQFNYSRDLPNMSSSRKLIYSVHVFKISAINTHACFKWRTDATGHWMALFATLYVKRSAVSVTEYRKSRQLKSAALRKISKLTIKKSTKNIYEFIKLTSDGLYSGYNMNGCTDEHSNFAR